jgi:hypothetical protein
VRNKAAPKNIATLDTASVLKAVVLVLKAFTMATLALVQKILASEAWDSVPEDSKVI